MKRVLWLVPTVLALAIVMTLSTTFANAAAQFKVTNLSISPTYITAGTGDVSITISAKVANIGNETGTYKLELKINNTTETTKDITLESGKDQTVIIPVTKKDAGEYNVTIDTEKGVFDIAPASLEVKNLFIDPLEASPGKEVAISVTVQNKSADQPLTYDSLKLFINQSLTDKKRIELKPGESTTVSFKVIKSESGIFVVNLGPQVGKFSITSSIFSTIPMFVWAIIGIIVLIIIIMIVMVLTPKKKKGGKLVGKSGGKASRGPMPGQPAFGQQGQPYPSAPGQMPQYPGQAQQMQPRPMPPLPGQPQQMPQYPGQAQHMQPQAMPQGQQMQPRPMPPLPGQPQQMPQYPGQAQHMQPQAMPQGQQMQPRPMPPLPGQPQQMPQYPGQAQQMQPRPMPPLPGQPQQPFPTQQQMPTQKPNPMGSPPAFIPTTQPGFTPQAFGIPGRHMPQFTVSNLTITPQQVKEGDSVNISAVVTNNTGTTGQYSMVLRIGGVVENISELTLNPGASQTALFTIIKDAAGDYYVEVDGQRGMFTVIHRLPAAFNISNLSITPDRVKQGEPITISAIITNSGETVGSYSVVLRIKGIAESIEEVELEPSRSQKVVFTITKDAAGFYPVALENLSGKFVVEMDWKG